MTDFPDPSKPPSYPEALDPAFTIQDEQFDDNLIPPLTEEQVAQAREWNQLLSNFVEIYNDIRLAIVALGLDPDLGDDLEASFELLTKERANLLLSSVIGFVGDPNTGGPPSVITDAISGTIYIDQTNTIIWQKPEDAGSWVQIFPQVSGGVSVEDEGSPVTGTPHTTLDFAGAGVTASDAGGGKATITIPGGGGGGGVPIIPYASGRWYSPSAGPAGGTFGIYGTGNSNFKDGRLGVVPYRVKEAISIDAIGVWLQGAFGDTAGDWRLGIWANSGSLPGALIGDSGEITIAVTAGDRDIFFALLSEALANDVVWMGGLPNGVTVNTRGREVVQLPTQFIDLGWSANLLDTTSSLLSGGAVGFIDGSNTSRSTGDTLPDPFPIGSLVEVDRNGSAEGQIIAPHVRIE